MLLAPNLLHLSTLGTATGVLGEKMRTGFPSHTQPRIQIAERALAGAVNGRGRRWQCMSVARPARKAHGISCFCGAHLGRAALLRRDCLPGTPQLKTSSIFYSAVSRKPWRCATLPEKGRSNKSLCLLRARLWGRAGVFKLQEASGVAGLCGGAN